MYVKQIIQNGAIQDDIAMIAHKGVALFACCYLAVLEGGTIAAFAKNILDNGFHEAQLKVQCAVYTYEGQSDYTVPKPLGQPREQCLQLGVHQPVVE